MTVPASMTSGFATTAPQGYLLRSTWNNGVDAVSALLMASTITNEYVLDAATASQTDWTLTFPTARFYVDASPAGPPFTTQFSATGACERIPFTPYNREQVHQYPYVPQNGGPPGPPPATACWSTNVVAWGNGFILAVIDKTSHVFGSPTLAMQAYQQSFMSGAIIPSVYQDGFVTLDLSPDGPGLTSLPTSTAIDLATGNVITGSHRFKGLPVVGFSAWIFNNGFLDCGGTTCRATFGMNLPHHGIRNVTRVP
jgi:hypothetical protein